MNVFDLRSMYYWSQSTCCLYLSFRHFRRKEEFLSLACPPTFPATAVHAFQLHGENISVTRSPLVNNNTAVGPVLSTHKDTGAFYEVFGGTPADDDYPYHRLSMTTYFEVYEKPDRSALVHRYDIALEGITGTLRYCFPRYPHPMHEPSSDTLALRDLGRPLVSTKPLNLSRERCGSFKPSRSIISSLDQSSKRVFYCRRTHQSFSKDGQFQTDHS